MYRMLRIAGLVLALLFFGVTAALAGEPVNVNTASQSQLESLPGIGPTKARAIIEYRDAKGTITSMSDFDQVPGIGSATLAGLEGKVTFDGTTPATTQVTTAEPMPEVQPRPASTSSSTGGRVNINTASQAELETLPGVGPAKALAILGDRDANGLFASCDDLTRVSGVGPATVANLSERCTVE